MDSRYNIRKLPPILEEKLEEAYVLLDLIPNNAGWDLLEKFRNNRSKCIATWGISNIGAKVDGLEYFPPELEDMLRQIDHAFNDLQRYKQGGADDYIAKDVADRLFSLKQSKNAKNTRAKKPIKEALIKEMRSYRKSEHTLQNFIDALKAGSITGFKIIDIKEVGKSSDSWKYTIESDVSVKDETITLKTLRCYWTEAAPD